MNTDKPNAVNLDLWLRNEGAGCLPDNVVSDGAIVGPYHVLGLLGRGGNAEVYRAVADDGTVVALKVPRNRDDAGAVERFRREVRILKEQSDKMFPRIVDSGEAGGLPWMAMEELSPCERPRTPRAVARHLAALCKGLERLHAHGLVHRDIKPSNILCRADGSPVLIDFGLVKEAAKTAPFPASSAPLSVATDGRAIGHGTPGWAAPEQFSGGDITPAADVYALGMLALDCFQGEPPRSWRPLLLRATAPIPAHRYPDAAAFARAIRRRHLPVLGRVAGLLLLCAVLGAATATVLRRPPDIVITPNSPSPVPLQALRDALRDALARSVPSSNTRILDTAPHLAKCLGFPGGGWLTSSDWPWEIDPDIPGAIRSSYHGLSYSVLSVPVDGPARVTVRYRRHFAGNKILGSDPKPRAFFAILDGEKTVFLDDEGDADASNPLGEECTTVVDVSEGFHRLRFVYHHSGIGYVDQFSGVRITGLRLEGKIAD